MITTTESKEKTVPAALPQLDLRDWFAGMALGHVIQVFDQHAPTSATRENFATEAYLIADAMLAHRAKARGEQP